MPALPLLLTTTPQSSPLQQRAYYGYHNACETSCDKYASNRYRIIVIVIVVLVFCLIVIILFLLVRRHQKKKQRLIVPPHAHLVPIKEHTATMAQVQSNYLANDNAYTHVNQNMVGADGQTVGGRQESGVEIYTPLQRPEKSLSPEIKRVT